MQFISNKIYRGYATHGQLNLFYFSDEASRHTHKNPNEKEKENGTSLGSVGSLGSLRHVPPRQPQKLTKLAAKMGNLVTERVSIQNGGRKIL